MLMSFTINCFNRVSMQGVSAMMSSKYLKCLNFTLVE